MRCTYCERPLICDSCEVEYVPPTAEAYAALSMDEVVIACPACGEVLTCHWCKTPYAGEAEADEEGGLAL